jgi:hypothetical protein
VEEEEQLDYGDDEYEDDDEKMPDSDEQGTPAQQTDRTVPIPIPASAYADMQAQIAALTARVLVAERKKTAAHSAMAKPPSFDGKGRIAVSPWIRQVERFLVAMDVDLTTDSSAAIASSYLSGDALVYYNAQVDQAKAEGQDMAFGEFEHFMLAAYGTEDGEFQARMSLQELTQGSGTTEAYRRAFVALVARIHLLPLSEGDKIFRFWFGLTKSLRNVLVTEPATGSPWTDLASLMTTAVHMDAGRSSAAGTSAPSWTEVARKGRDGHHQQQSKRPGPPSGKSDGQGTSASQQPQRKKSEQPSKRQKLLTKLPKEVKDHRFLNKQCLNCGSNKHSAKECTNPYNANIKD